MKKILILIFCLSESFNGVAQGSQNESDMPSSKIIAEVSYYWKIDSLGQNGYRLCNYKKILKSSLDEVTIDFLLKKLCTPNFIVKDNSGTYYSYYYFNGRIIPKDIGFSEELMYISFKVNTASSVINYISQGAEDE